jgi:hypothetical protein
MVALLASSCNKPAENNHRKPNVQLHEVNGIDDAPVA